MLVRNTRVLGYNTSPTLQTIFIQNGKLIINPQPVPPTTKVIDAHGKYTLMPGWLDSHVHGFGGADFADLGSSDIASITKALGNKGLSYCFATLVSLSIPDLKKALARIDNYVREHNRTPGSAVIVGVIWKGLLLRKIAAEHMISMHCNIKLISIYLKKLSPQRLILKIGKLL